ncbi:MAG TPA: DUF6679 family protein [Vampirovibrionales bacterium]
METIGTRSHPHFGELVRSPGYSRFGEKYDLAIEKLFAQEKPPMLHRKIYQFCCDGREVSIFLRDQQRWIDGVRILDIEGDLVTIRYETDEEDELSSWEEMFRLESIGAVSQKIACVSRGNVEPLVSDDCPEAEQIPKRSPDLNQE